MLDGKRARDHRRRDARLDRLARGRARAQESGAEVVLTGFGRAQRLTERAARSLPAPPDVLELDVNSEDDLLALRAELDEPLGPRRRRAARDRVRAARRARRRLPGDARRQRGAGVPDQRVLAQGADRGAAAAVRPRARGERRRPRLRRQRRLAGLRLDGRLEGRARVGLALPGARSRTARRARQPRLGRADRDARRGRHPGLRQARGRLGAGAPLGWDVDDAGPVADAVCFLLSDLGRGDHRRDPARRRRLPRDRRGCVARPRSRGGCVDERPADRRDRLPRDGDARAAARAGRSRRGDRPRGRSGRGGRAACGHDATWRACRKRFAIARTPCPAS